MIIPVSCVSPSYINIEIVSVENQEEVAVMDKRKRYEEKLDAQLEEWSAQMALLKAKADSAMAEVKIQYYKTIEDLQYEQDTARMKLGELKGASDEAWEEIKTGVEEAWTVVQDSLRSAASKFK